jgi:hypothetical protein
MNKGKCLLYDTAGIIDFSFGKPQNVDIFINHPIRESHNFTNIRSATFIVFFFRSLHCYQH